MNFDPTEDGDIGRVCVCVCVCVCVEEGRGVRVRVGRAH